MKKLLLVLVFVLLSGAVFADMPILFGVDYSHGQLNWLTQSSNMIMSGNTYYLLQEVTFPNNRFGIFFDAYFIRIDVAYTYQTYASMAVYSNSIRTTMSSAKSTGFWYNSVDISLLAKLPIPIGKSANIWIGAGVEYSINIALDVNENGTNLYRYGGTDGHSFEGRDLNDIYGILAVGASVDLAENIALVPMFRFGWNFTPTPTTDAYITDAYGPALTQLVKDNNKWSMFKYDMGIGLAIKL